MILNKIHSNREKYIKDGHQVDHCEYFIAVILPEGADKHEILRLETTYQMGEDEKLDYNAIEKYLRCKDLVADGFKTQDIASMMNEEKSKIEEWLQIMDLMDQYLESLGYTGIYTRLDKTEGQFVDLNQYLNRYNNETTFVSWGYQDLDINDLKAVCFDYIRARYEGKEFRYIAKPSKKDSIFCKSQELWKSFLNEHNEFMKKINEIVVDETIKKHQGENLSKVLEARDDDWTTQVENQFVANLRKHKSRLDDINQANQPLELARRAFGTLDAIRTDVEQFYGEEVYDELKKINQLTYQYMKRNKTGYTSEREG
jgi:hypothetical protein